MPSPQSPLPGWDELRQPVELYLVHVPGLRASIEGAIRCAPNTTQVAPGWLPFILGLVISERHIEDPVGIWSPDDAYESIVQEIGMYISAQLEIAHGRGHRNVLPFLTSVADEAYVESVQTDQMTYLWEAICAIMIALDQTGINRETPLRLIGVQGDQVVVSPLTSVVG